MPRSVSAIAMLVLTSTLLLIPSRILLAQQVRLSGLLGAGYASWTGPLVESGRFGSALAAVAVEWPATPRIALRGEGGADAVEANLGQTGLLGLKTKLSLYRVHLAALGRAYLPHRAGAPALYAEVGGSFWRRMGCDVDLLGGPGFFGGETIGCDQWSPDTGTGASTLQPNASGAGLVGGVGAYRGRLGVSLRIEAGGGALVQSSGGDLHARVLRLAGEWLFRGHH